MIIGRRRTDSEDRRSCRARLLKIGARRYPWTYPPGADYVVLEDPDGNLFCVVQKNDEI